MKKTFYILIFFLTMAVFSSILPYPVLSNYTNLTESNAYEINNHNESELVLQNNQSPSVVNLNFKEVTNLLDGEFKVYDLKSGLCFYAWRTGGKNHADIEPSSQEDVQVLEEICQFNPNWKRRSVLVQLSEYAFVPASMTTYPHGYGTIENGMYGHICLHFKHSKTDGTNKEDYHHQKCVAYAAKNGQKFIDSLDL